MKVLIAIDNKPSSQAIIDALVKMHWNDGTELQVITVLEARSNGQVAEANLDEMEELAVELHDALPQCEVTFHAIKGDPKTLILETAKQVQAQLIVIGSNCKNTLERVLLGSVCQEVLNAAHCPVIVAKAPCCLAREASPGFRNILLPVDNSKYSDLVIEWLSSFHWGQECRFILAAVAEPDSDLNAVRQSLQARAEVLSGLVRTNNISFEIAVGDPHKSIIELAEKYYADLIAIGSHGRSGLKKLILGNVAQAVSHDAPCALAVVRGLAPDDQSWIETGTFEKAKPIPIHALIHADDFKRREDDDRTPGVMPGGMG